MSANKVGDIWDHRQGDPPEDDTTDGCGDKDFDLKGCWDCKQYNSCLQEDRNE